MRPINNEETKSNAIWKIWQEGLGRGAAIILIGGSEEELRQVWMETIDLMMEQIYESSEDFNEWKQLSLDERYKEIENKPINYDGFVGDAQSAADMIKTRLGYSQPNEENARKIISRAFSRAANCKAESVIDLDPCTELISSEKILELGITKENLTESLLLDPQVKSVDCINGEFIVNTIGGEIKFRLVFGDDITSGHS